MINIRPFPRLNNLIISVEKKKTRKIWIPYAEKEFTTVNIYVLKDWSNVSIRTQTILMFKMLWKSSYEKLYHLMTNIKRKLYR